MKEWTISSMVTKSLEQVLNWYASVSFIHSVLNLFICLVSPQLIIKNLSCVLSIVVYATEIWGHVRMNLFPVLKVFPFFPKVFIVVIIMKMVVVIVIVVDYILRTICRGYFVLFAIQMLAISPKASCTYKVLLKNDLLPFESPVRNELFLVIFIPLSFIDHLVFVRKGAWINYFHILKKICYLLLMFEIIRLSSKLFFELCKNICTLLKGSTLQEGIKWKLKSPFLSSSPLKLPLSLPREKYYQSFLM